MLKSSSLCLYSSNLDTFWLKIEQFWPFEEISIFSNGSHLGYRTALTDTILKGDHPRIISGTWRFFWIPLFESSSWLDKIHILGRFSFPTKDMLIFLQRQILAMNCFQFGTGMTWGQVDKSRNHLGSDGMEITSSTPCSEYYTPISLHFLCDCQWNDGASQYSSFS